MKLHYYKPSPESSNFGDELNLSFWNHFYPEFFDEKDDEVFFGIGTILRAAKKQYPKSKIQIMGSGAHAASQKLETNFKVWFVRGPKTAQALGINEKLAITDPAILTPLVHPVNTIKKKYSVSYMPHYSVANESYKNACKKLSIHYIDPRDDVASILDVICASETIITEAMHGAILADAYRIPWIPVATYQSFNHFKWQDWLLSMKIDTEINKLPRLYASKKGFKAKLKIVLFQNKLKSLKKMKPVLSSDEVDAMRREQVLLKIGEFRESQIR